jgi:hypothetical protein
MPTDFLKGFQTRIPEAFGDQLRAIRGELRLYREGVYPSWRGTEIPAREEKPLGVELKEKIMRYFGVQVADRNWVDYCLKSNEKACKMMSRLRKIVNLRLAAARKKDELQRKIVDSNLNRKNWE